jgi:tetratricopeptide (TPR) repeat protein
MDWTIFGAPLSCDAAMLGLRVSLAVLGGLAAFFTVCAYLYKLYRWSAGPDWRHKRAADALRDEGAYRASINHGARAMELFDLSIQVNPRAAHTYYLRGCLKEQQGELPRAIADWQRCIERLATHAGALERLRRHPAKWARKRARFPWLYIPIAGAATLLGLFAISLFARYPTPTGQRRLPSLLSGVLNRTPAPVVSVSSMNAIPAASSARRNLCSVEIFESAPSSSKPLIVTAATPDFFAKSSRDHFSSDLAARS